MAIIKYVRQSCAGIYLEAIKAQTLFEALAEFELRCPQAKIISVRVCR